MKDKIIMIILFILFTICITCGIYGLILNIKFKSGNPNNPNIPGTSIQNNITYKYYLESEEVNEIPKNTITSTKPDDIEKEKDYIFKKYTCTNGISGMFNNEKWEFVIENNNDNTKGTCDLYFVKSKYNVTFTLKNAIEDENNLKIIDRETDGIFKFIPNDGYIYKSTTCTNNKEPIWNDKDKSLTINAIMSDTNCEVEFERKQLKINVIVKNGNGNTTETVFYGDGKTIIISPKDGYQNAKVSCTNKQTATFDNNTIIIDKLTNDTTCTVTYQAIPKVNYKISISNPKEFPEITLISDSEQAFETGKEGKVILRATDGSTPTLNCGDNIPTSKILDSDGTTKTIEFSFYNMSNNVTCQIIK